MALFSRSGGRRELGDFPGSYLVEKTYPSDRAPAMIEKGRARPIHQSKDLNKGSHRSAERPTTPEA
jgi:hypothetical protein